MIMYCTMYILENFYFGLFCPPWPRNWAWRCNTLKNQINCETYFGSHRLGSSCFLVIIPSEVRRIIFPISTRKQQTGEHPGRPLTGQGKCRMQHSPLRRVVSVPRHADVNADCRIQGGAVSACHGALAPGLQCCSVLGRVAANCRSGTAVMGTENDGSLLVVVGDERCELQQFLSISSQRLQSM